MKKRILFLSVIFLVSSSLPAFSSCEKWKSEWLSVSINRLVVSKF